jgi:valyl-tRNA synthetase
MEKVILGKVYDLKGVEEKWYRYWEEMGYFRADVNKDAKPYSIVIPPPNITGSLHMGHALNNTLQDIMVRYKRMDGYNVLWMPGTDHAGIATQNVVEKELEKEGLKRTDIGRERFIERVWQWKERYGGVIIRQLKRLGASCDWSRERFTMDEGLSRAVREVFVSLYEEGLIYKGNYIINWCPRCTTALSDLEVEHEEHSDYLYFIRYPIDGEDQFLTVATTRPETLLGDTAVAIHPEDTRYINYHGRFCILPLMNRKIPIIIDNYVDPKFGTGILKITPAHDPNDFEIGKRHNLEQIKVIDEYGKMNERAGRYSGLDRFECRQRVIEDLKSLGLLSQMEEYRHNVGHCHRCKTVIEPFLSEQWFVKVKPLAEKAIQAVKEGRTRIIPQKWENDYFEWMNNIKDWCISRQIWWGHRIPAWYCKDCGEIIVARSEPERCKSCGSSSLEQETDVLDTWFSSALWPFSTMGWPEKTKELSVYYPTSLLVTGFDILTFWVARMLMMGIKFMGDVPFRDVYIHALVRDIEGHKMSKSRGNVIDPLVVIEKYGADAFRFALAAFAAQGRDIRLSMERIQGYRNFVNKIWNASRFVLINLDGYEGSGEEIVQNGEDLIHRWIMDRLCQTIKKVRDGLDNYRFNDAADAIYQFVWHEFCDWYLELIKPILNMQRDSADRNFAQSVMLIVLKNILKLLHPFMPFVTEEIWHHLPGTKGSIMISSFPKEEEFKRDEEAYHSMSQIISIITAIRNIRSELSIHPSIKINAALISKDKRTLDILRKHSDYISLLCKIEDISIGDNIIPPEKGISTMVKGVEVHIQLEGLVDLEKELKRLTMEKEKLKKELSRVRAKLANEDFLSNAPKEVVEKERLKESELSEKERVIEDRISKLLILKRGVKTAN